ncbi:MAG TPA: hypothetical protein VFD89_07000 [Clostridia bacterium]|nr:hypothetical protein [Clostridia bacterium]
MEERTNVLKPMTVSEILDDTFRVYGKNLWTVLIYSAVIGGIFSLIVSFITGQMMVPVDTFFKDWMNILENPNIDPETAFGPIMEMMPRFFALQGMVTLLSLIGLIFVNPFIQGGIINVTYSYITGRSMSINESLISTLKKFWKLILTSLSLIPYFIGVGIAFVILTVISIIPLVLSGISMSKDPTGGRIVGFIFLIFVAVALMIILAVLAGMFITFTFHVATTEESYGFNAIGRSFKLVAKKFWRVLGISLLINLIVGIIAGIIALVSGITSLVTPFAAISNYMTGFITSAFITPIIHISTTLLFMDTKARVEPRVHDGYYEQIQNQG